MLVCFLHAHLCLQLVLMTQLLKLFWVWTTHLMDVSASLVQMRAYHVIALDTVHCWHDAWQDCRSIEWVSSSLGFINTSLKNGVTLEEVGLLLGKVVSDLDSV